MQEVADVCNKWEEEVVVLEPGVEML